LTRYLSGLAHNQSDRWIEELAYKVGIEGFREGADAQRLTGNWIVYGIHNGLNYYLDLASHEEGEGNNACRLLAKLSAGDRAEFPFLFGEAHQE